MNDSKKIADCVNDLVQINHDRTAGYNKAAEETEDSELKMLFPRNSSQSEQFASELASVVSTLGEKPVEGTRTDGKLYRAWMDVKTALSGKSRKAVLNACEYGEDVAKKSYEDALKDDGELPANIRELIKRQFNDILKAHDEIKSMRDAEETVKS